MVMTAGTMIEPLTTEWRFKLLYDGECPICVGEATWLARRSKAGGLALEDISAPEFDAAKYGVSAAELMRALHGVYPDGKIVSGVPAFREAYRVAGLGWVFAASEWPLFGWCFRTGYAIFARHRIRIGMMLGRKCESGACGVKRAK